MQDDIQSILLGEAQIQSRLDELAAEIQQVYTGQDLTVVGVLTGSVMFVADLLKRLPIPLRLDNIGISSYRGGTRATDELVITKELRLDVRGREVLVIDDILDSGATLQRLRALLGSLGPRRVRCCVFLEKERSRPKPITADFVAFRIPDRFVVGYGLDYQERYRNLPYVAVLRPEIVAAGK